jgi:hypothetical protein
LGTLRKLDERGYLRIAYFIVERLYHELSCVEACKIISTADNPGLERYTLSIIARKRFLSRGGDVSEVATEEGGEEMPDVAIAVATELTTGGELSYPLPDFFLESRKDVVFLSSLCHDQVSSFVLKRIIVSQQYLCCGRH